MSRYTKTFLENCLTRCQNNEIDILGSKECTCANCTSIFSAREVVDWDNAGGTSHALCPYCGFGLVVGDTYAGEITEELSSALNDHYLETSNEEMINWHMRRFCGLFSNFSISDNTTNTALFVGYALALSAGSEDDRFVLDALRILAFGKGDYKADPVQAIRLIEERDYRVYPKCLSLLGMLYYNHLGEESDKTQNQKAFRCTKDAALLGDLTSIAFLSSLYLSGMGTKKDEKMAFAILEQSFPRALEVTLDSSPYADIGGAGVFFSHFADITLLRDEEDGYEPNYRDLLRYYLLAKQCLLSTNIAEDDQAIATINEQIKEVAEHFAPDGFDTNMVYDAHCFYDSFVDFGQIRIPFVMESARFDPSKNTLSLVLAPYNHFILVDTSSGGSRISSKERIEFVFEGVVRAILPEGPFVFTSIATMTEDLLSWQFLDGTVMVGEITFDPLYMEEANDEE